MRRTSQSEVDRAITAAKAALAAMPADLEHGPDMKVALQHLSALLDLPPHPEEETSTPNPENPLPQTPRRMRRSTHTQAEEMLRVAEKACAEMDPDASHASEMVAALEHLSTLISREAEPGEEAPTLADRYPEEEAPQNAGSPSQVQNWFQKQLVAAVSSKMHLHNALTAALERVAEAEDAFREVAQELQETKARVEKGVAPGIGYLEHTTALSEVTAEAEAAHHALEAAELSHAKSLHDAQLAHQDAMPKALSASESALGELRQELEIAEELEKQDLAGVETLQAEMEASKAMALEHAAADAAAERVGLDELHAEALAAAHQGHAVARDLAQSEHREAIEELAARHASATELVSMGAQETPRPTLRKENKTLKEKLEQQRQYAVMMDAAALENRQANLTLQKQLEKATNELEASLANRERLEVRNAATEAALATESAAREELGVTCAQQTIALAEADRANAEALMDIEDFKARLLREQERGDQEEEQVIERIEAELHHALTLSAALPGIQDAVGRNRRLLQFSLLSWLHNKTQSTASPVCDSDLALSDFRHAVAEKDTRRAKLEAEAIGHEEVNAEMTAATKVQIDRASALEEMLAANAASIAELNQQLTRERETSRERLEQQTCAFEAQLKAKDALCGERDEAVGSLMASLATLKQGVAKNVLENEANHAQRESKAAQQAGELAAVKAELAEALSPLKPWVIHVESSRNVDAMNDVVSIGAHRVVKMEEELAVHRAAIRLKEGSIADLTALLAAGQANEEALDARLATMEAALREKDIHIENAEHSSLLMAHGEVANKVNEEHQEARTAVNAMGMEAAALEHGEAIQSHEEAMRELRALDPANEARVHAAEEEVKKLQEEVEKLQEELGLLHHVYEDQVGSKDREIARLWHHHRSSMAAMASPGPDDLEQALENKELQVLVARSETERWKRKYKTVSAQNTPLNTHRSETVQTGDSSVSPTVLSSPDSPRATSMASPAVPDLMQGMMTQSIADKREIANKEKTIEELASVLESSKAALAATQEERDAARKDADEVANEALAAMEEISKRDQEEENELGAELERSSGVREELLGSKRDLEAAQRASALAESVVADLQNAQAEMARAMAQKLEGLQAETVALMEENGRLNGALVEQASTYEAELAAAMAAKLASGEAIKKLEAQLKQTKDAAAKALADAAEQQEEEDEEAAAALAQKDDELNEANATHVAQTYAALAANQANEKAMHDELLQTQHRLEDANRMVLDASKEASTARREKKKCETELDALRAREEFVQKEAGATTVGDDEKTSPSLQAMGPAMMQRMLERHLKEQAVRQMMLVSTRLQLRIMRHGIDNWQHAVHLATVTTLANGYKAQTKHLRNTMVKEMARAEEAVRVLKANKLVASKWSPTSQGLGAMEPSALDLAAAAAPVDGGGQ